MKLGLFTNEVMLLSCVKEEYTKKDNSVGVMYWINLFDNDTPVRVNTTDVVYSNLKDQSFVKGIANFEYNLEYRNLRCVGFEIKSKS